MVRFALLLLIFVSSSSAIAQFSDPVNKTARGVNYREIVVSVNVPYESCFLFSCTKKEGIMRGLLLLPDEIVSKPPYNLLVRSHGAQAWGGGWVHQSYSVGFHEVRLLGLGGYAVLYPMRKGFSVNDLPRSDMPSPDTTEPISCDGAESGIKSATSDVKAYLNVLATRNDVNLNRIILSGFSRGGIVSLALASEGHPGVVGVYNISGGWLSEGNMQTGGAWCGGSVNERLFRELGSKIKVPVISLYGGRDPFYSVGAIRHWHSFLGKNAPADLFIASQSGHTAALVGQDFEIFIAKLKNFHKLIDLPY